MKLKYTTTPLMAVECFFKSRLEDRNLEAALSCLTEDVTWFGTGAFETVTDIYGAHCLMAEEINGEPIGYTVKFADMIQSMCSDSIGTVFGRVIITHDASGSRMECRMSATCICYDNGNYKISTLHTSLPSQLQQEQEFYPISFSENKLREIKDNFFDTTVPGGVVCCKISIGFPIKNVNTRLISMLGYDSREELLKATNGFFANCIYQDDNPGEMVSKCNTLCDGAITSFTYRMITKTGAIIWVRDYSQISTDEHGTRIRFCYCTDVTDIIKMKSNLKQQQQDLELTHKELQTLLDTLPGGISVYEITNGKITTIFYNEGVPQMLGYTVSEYEGLVKNDALARVFDEDRPRLTKSIVELADNDIPIDCQYRLHTKDNGYVWVNLRGTSAIRTNNSVRIHVMFIVITAEKEAEQRLRIREQEYRIAINHSGKMVYRYTIADKTIHMAIETAQLFGLPPTMSNVPYSIVEADFVAPESVDAFIGFYESILSGNETESVVVRRQINDGSFRWFRACSTLVKNDAEEPVSAVISIEDVTQQRQNELAFEAWKQSVNVLTPNKFRIAEHNITKDICTYTEGELFNIENTSQAVSFDDNVDYLIRHIIYCDDAPLFRKLMTREHLIAAFHEGDRTHELDLRIVNNVGELCWIRLVLSLLGEPNSTGIMAYMLYTDIDEEKRQELSLIERSEGDALTKLLNREAFARHVDELINDDSSDSRHAVIMIDIDSFKSVNDIYGHAVGDETLVTIAKDMRCVLAHNDLIGRIGGDEFMIFVKDAPIDSMIEKKAQQICAIMRKSIGELVSISGSLGIAIYPSDGNDFYTLYKNADAALYQAKENGKDGYAFYNSNMKTYEVASITSHNTTDYSAKAQKKRILVVDDSELDQSVYNNILGDKYTLKRSMSGKDALAMLKRYGNSFSAILLDIFMKDMDGFEVLREIMNNLSLRSVPVIMISAEVNEETALSAIEHGATDFVSKPVNPQLLYMRVSQAIMKSEHAKMRIQNSYQLMQAQEEARYRSVLSGTGTIVFEMNVTTEEFVYDKLASKYLFGTYDKRTLWQILKDHSVASDIDITIMRQMVADVASAGSIDGKQLKLQLKAVDGTIRWFRLNVMRMSVEFSLAQKLLLIFNDINDEKLAEENFRERAENDMLTGIYNRETFLQKAAQIIKAKPKNTYVVVYYDIDRFKAINEMFGYAEGDRFLYHVAHAMKESLGDKGICCRISADVFALCAPNDIDFLRNHLMVDCNKAFTGYNLPFSISSVFGVYVVSDTNLSVNTMLDYAALAQRNIKGNYVTTVAYFDESIHKKELLEKEIIRDMETALLNGQFEVYFQPQYSHRTGAVIGAEALIRWNHPKRGLIPPCEFIPLFEQNGFVSMIDHFVSEQVLAMLKKRHDANKINIPISVNLSRVNIYDPDLCNNFKDLFEKYILPTSLLRVEITEGAFVDDPKRLSNTVRSLQMMGFTVEMDDFGSGYSSLNVLKDIPVDIIKLDMRFLSQTDDNDRSGSIINSVIRMTKWLRVPVIAEGVETIEQADYLKSLGCDYVQGYLYAHPMSMTEFEELLDKSITDISLPVIKSIKTLDLNEFQNPKSLDTLVFNHFLGAACVIEYFNNSVEILRANDDYLRVLGIGKADFDELRLALLTSMTPKSKIEYFEMINKAIKTNDVAECISERYLQGETGTMSWIKVRVRVIANSDERFILYAVVENVTEKEIASLALSLQISKQSTLIECIRQLYNIDNLPEAMENTLRYVSVFYKANRCSVLLRHKHGNLVSNAYNYSEDRTLKVFSCDMLELNKCVMVNKAFDDVGRINRLTIDQLLVESMYEYNAWKSLNIGSALYIGLSITDELDGVLVVYDVKINVEDGNLLETVAYYIANTLRIHCDSNSQKSC